MWFRLLTITSLFLSFILLDCNLPAPPPGPENSFIALEFKNSNGDIAQNNLIDTIGKQIKICMIHNLTQYIDSSVLKITMGTEFSEIYPPIRSFKAQVDTTQYPVLFTIPGTYVISFTGYIDGRANTLSGTIKILDRSQSNQNQKPVLTVPGAQRIGAGQELIFTVSAADPDANQTVKISVSKKPHNATFISNQFKWTPTINDTGIVTVVFSAIDDGLPVLSTTDSVTIVIGTTLVNRAPLWNSKKILRSTLPEVQFSLELNSFCSDPDNDTISFTLLSEEPSKDTVVNSMYQFKPLISDTGKFSIHIIATDPSGLTDTTTIELTVSSTPDTKAPHFKRISPAKDSVKVSSSSIQVAVSFKDESGIDSVKCSMGTKAFKVVKSGDSTYTATVTDLQTTGWNVVTFIATDASPVNNPCTLLVYIKYDNTIQDTTPPVITFQSPSKDTIVSVDSFEVKVTCVDASGCSVKGYLNETAIEMKKTASAADLWTGIVKGLSAGNYSTVKIIATDSSTSKNKDSLTVRIKLSKQSTFTLTTNASNGSVTRSPDLANYDSGTVVTLIPVPAAGYHFTGWSGDTSSTVDSLMIKMYANLSVTANFEINSYQLTITTADDGSGGTIAKPASSPVSVNHGALTTIKAVPEAGFIFSGWTVTSGTATITSASAESTTVALLSGNATITAGFTLNTCELTVMAGTGGLVTAPAGVFPKTVNSCTATTITASANENYKFVNWTISPNTAGTIADPTSVTTSVTLTNGNATVTANFSLNTYQLSVSAGTGGSITAPTGTFPKTVNSGAATTITAGANANYKFVNWTISPNTAGTIANPASVTTSVTLTTGDATVTANFSLNTYQLSVSAGTGGSITAPTGTFPKTVNSGVATTITASVNANYKFVNWTISPNTAGTIADPTSVTTTVTLSSSNATVTANFSLITYQLSVSAGTGGTISVPTGPFPVTVNSGESTTITAAPSSSYNFSGWTITAGSATITSPNQASTTVKLTSGNATIRANFTLKTYSLTVSAGNGGNVTEPVSSPVTVNHGAKTLIEAVASSGYEFGNWTVTSGTATIDAPGSSSTNVSLTSGNATVTANFTCVPIIISNPTAKSVCNNTWTYFYINSASGGGTGRLFYTWKRNGIVLSDGTNYKDTKTATLQVLANSATAGNFTCTVDNGVGCSSTTTAVALSIKATSLVIQSQPSSQNLAPGALAPIDVTVTGGSGVYSYQWYFNGAPFNANYPSSSSGSGTSRLDYINGTECSNGEYYCVIKDEDGVTCPITTTIFTITTSGTPCGFY